MIPGIRYHDLLTELLQYHCGRAAGLPNSRMVLSGPQQLHQGGRTIRFYVTFTLIKNANLILPASHLNLFSIVLHCY